MKFFAIVVLGMFAVVSAAINGLSTYKISDTTASGLSSGGYMAVQVHIAFSSFFNGSAVFAGGPYYCAQDNLMTAEYKCMKTTSGAINVNSLVTTTNNWATTSKIDSTANLKDDRVYLFSGADDSVISPSVMHSLQTYYGNFVPSGNIVANFNLPAEHCIPTLAYGEACATLGSPYIGKCNFDGAGNAFQTLFGALNPMTTAVPANLFAFNQKSYIPTSLSGTSLADQGWIYVPTTCANGASCHLHFAFHGCLQTEDDIGNNFAQHAGYNEWAESNNIIVVYPYCKKSYSMPSNPNGCWDWWGYTNSNYAVQAGVQMTFVQNMYKALTGTK